MPCKFLQRLLHMQSWAKAWMQNLECFFRNKTSWEHIYLKEYDQKKCNCQWHQHGRMNFKTASWAAVKSSFISLTKVRYCYDTYEMYRCFNVPISDLPSMACHLLSRLIFSSTHNGQVQRQKGKFMTPEGHTTRLKYMFRSRPPIIIDTF